MVSSIYTRPSYSLCSLFTKPSKLLITILQDSHSTMSNPNKRKATDPLEQIGDIINDLPQGLSGSDTLQAHVIIFTQGKFPRDPFPRLADLNSTYSDVSKAELLSVVSICARLLYLGAQVAILKNENLSTAEGVLRKWQRCAHTDTPHCGQILQNRSVDEVRKMLASAFADLQACIEIGGAMEDFAGCPVIKSDAGQLGPGQDWY